MGHWGVASYENDGAADALDAAFERVHGERYNDLMDDRNPLSFDEIQGQLASPETLAAAIEALREEVGPETGWDDWDDLDRLAFVGVVVRHLEFGVPISDEHRARALDWLEHEAIDWDEGTLRRLRKARETALLTRRGAST
jgi:hypothetical protein